MNATERAATISLATRLHACCTDEQARLAFSDAVMDGAPLAVVVEAMSEWCETHAADVQRIQSAAVTP